ncbi:MAG: Smr/MutS family protein [Proteobacteria bacterium]|nr:DNA mismatch repair protein MutS [Pseudomonadota bacterium]NOG61290.1 Smr/MutS family protein [Pseudomonadota bacterium]
MKKSTTISEEDSAMFREAVGKIKPLKQDSVVHDKAKPSATPSRIKQDDRPAMQELYDSEYDQNLLERGDELFFSRPDIQKQTIRKLRRGQFKIEDELDLHGLTVEMARTELSNFLADCHMRSLRCVRIIHGKGIGSENMKPVIKNKVNHWLRQRNDALAFCSAQQVDGGTGAIYLLLKRN